MLVILCYVLHFPASYVPPGALHTETECRVVEARDPYAAARRFLATSTEVSKEWEVVWYAREGRNLVVVHYECPKGAECESE